MVDVFVFVFLVLVFDFICSIGFLLFGRWLFVCFCVCDVICFWGLFFVVISFFISCCCLFCLVASCFLCVVSFVFVGFVVIYSCWMFANCVLLFVFCWYNIFVFFVCVVCCCCFFVISLFCFYYVYVYMFDVLRFCLWCFMLFLLCCFGLFLVWFWLLLILLLLLCVFRCLLFVFCCVWVCFVFSVFFCKAWPQSTQLPLAPRGQQLIKKHLCYCSCCLVCCVFWHLGLALCLYFLYV